MALRLSYPPSVVAAAKAAMTDLSSTPATGDKAVTRKKALARWLTVIGYSAHPGFNVSTPCIGYQVRLTLAALQLREGLKVTAQFDTPTSAFLNITGRAAAGIASHPLVAVDKPTVVGLRTSCKVGVLHCTEITSLPDAEQTCERVASSMARGQFGCHYIVQVNGRAAAPAPWTSVVQHVASHNHTTLGIEQCANPPSAGYSTEKWMTEHRDQIYSTAWLLAVLAKTGPQIPLRRIAPADNSRVNPDPLAGWLEHRHVADNDHTDCEPGYPLDGVLRLAVEFARRGGPPALIQAHIKAAR